MIERVTRYSQEHPHDALLWLSIEIERKRVALFRRWAQHLDCSDADLAARIFTEGTIQLTLMTMDDTSPAAGDDETATLVEGLLDDLERHSDARPITKEGQHAADHN